MALQLKFKMDLKTNDEKLSCSLPVEKENDYFSNLKPGSNLPPDNYPFMMYQHDFLEEIDSIRSKLDKLKRIKDLIDYNDWHFNPVENYNRILEFNLSKKDSNYFPSKYYRVESTLRDGNNKIIGWEQGVFESSKSYKHHLSTIGNTLLIHASLIKQENNSLAGNKRKKNSISLDQIIINGDVEQFRKAFIEILNLNFLSKTKRIQQAISFIISNHLRSNYNASAMSTLLINEFGQKLELKINPLRKALSKEQLSEITVNKKVSDLLTPFF